MCTQHRWHGNSKARWNYRDLGKLQQFQNFVKIETWQ